MRSEKRLKKSILKLVLLGNKTKTTTLFRQKYLGEGFEADYQETIGTDFAVSRSILRLNVDDREVILQIWDLSSSPRFGSVREIYYQGALGCLLIFNPFDRNSFTSLADWINELDKNNTHPNIPVTLVGYYSRDELLAFDDRSVSKAEAENYAHSLKERNGYSVGYLDFSETKGDDFSVEIENILRELVRTIFQYVNSQQNI